MSYHDSITTKEQDNLDIDASTNFAEEPLLEQDQTHQEKFTTATRNEDSEHRSSLSSQQSLPNPAGNCTLHPEEILQFYCFNDNTLLCAECLVKGKYGGMDIANLRRAAEKLKGKLGELARESTSKIEDCAVLGKDIETQQNQIKEMFTSYKEEIKEKMNILRQAIDQREQEIFNKIDGIQNEKLTVINTTESSLRSYREGMELLRSTVQYKLSELDDISVCRSYMTKADAFKENLNDEVCNRVQRVKKMVDRHQVQDQVSFFKLRDEWMKAQAAINEIGNGISNTTKPESPSLRDAEIGGSQRMLSADSAASYTSKERTSPERRIMYKESLKSQTLKDENSRQRQTPSFISVSNSGGIRSPVGSPRQTSARGPLMVEIRRGDLSQTDMGSGSTLNRRNSPSNINRYKNPLSIKTDTYEPLYSPKGSPRPTNLAYGSTASFLSTSPRYTANFNNSIIATQSPKYTSPSRKATLEASLSQLGTYNTVTETGQTSTKERLLSPERLTALKNESFNGLEEYVNNRKGKGQGQGVQSPSGASNLKSKLKELNAQIFK